MKNESIYAIVAQRIIEELENGVIPWHKPWFGTPDGPFSRSTGKPYSFINQILLGKPGEYLTFKQIQEAGGKLKKGSKAKMVVFFKPYTISEKDEDGNEVKKTIPLLRYYNVFHIEDTEGIEPKHNPIDKVNAPCDEAEKVINNYINQEDAPKFTAKKSDRAYYSPSLDEVVVPELSQYEAVEEYYSTAFHELVHSTMKETRCNRKCSGSLAAFGSEDYGKEELIAELGSASLINICGIETDKSFKNSASYIDSWLEAIKKDNSMITLAAIKAGQAVEFILNSADLEEKPEDDNKEEAKQDVKTPLQKAQEAIYKKYSKKHLEHAKVQGFDFFTDTHIVFGTSNLNLDIQDNTFDIEKIIKQWGTGLSDGLHIDDIKVDIKALKAMKEDKIIIKTSKGEKVVYSIPYIQDAFKFLGIKGKKNEYINIKLFKSGKAVILGIINNNSMVYVLNIAANDDIEKAYEVQNTKISDYYKVINK